jgi:formate-dependent nitrite reductase cytochrome c552 subunit
MKLKKVINLDKKIFLWVLGLAMYLTMNSMINNNIVQAQSIDEYVGPEVCKECHTSNFEEWEDSKHSQAFKDPKFQEEWEVKGNEKECLQCHTTGYDTTLQEYAIEGVTCEACHGAGLKMEVNDSSELCGSCHTGEYGQKKFEEFQEGTHFDSGVTCVNCHMYEENHTFEIESKACASCHTDEDIHSRRMIGDLQIKARDAENRVTQVEEEQESLIQEIAEMEKRAVLVSQITYLGGGALVVLAVIVTLLFIRQRRKVSEE